MRRVAAVCAVVALVVGAGWVLTRPRGPERDRPSVAEAWLVGAGDSSPDPVWPGITVGPGARRMPTWGSYCKTAIPGSSFSGGVDMVFQAWPGADQVIQEMDCGGPKCNATCSYVSKSGSDITYQLRLSGGGGLPVGAFYVVTLPESGLQEVRLQLRWDVTDAKVRTRHGTTPLGAKTNSTHAKEAEGEDSWYLPGTATFHASFGPVDNPTLCEWTRSVAGDFNLSMSLGPFQPDPDAWSDYPGAIMAGYEDITFAGNAVDMSGYTRTWWYGSDPTGLWAQGVGGDIQFGGSTTTYNYPEWVVGSISAPLFFDMSELYVLGSDNVDIPTLEVWCTGVRTLTTGGDDAGPTKHTAAEWRALDEIHQTHGFHSWDTWDADLHADTAFYIDGPSARAHGLEGFPAASDGTWYSHATDACCEIEGWPLSKTSREAEPWVTNVLRIAHRDWVGIYGPNNAVNAASWVASAGCTTPNAAGQFLVSEEGATLTLTLPNAYVTRQAAGGPGAVAPPGRYRNRKAGVYYPTEAAEAVYCWLGWGYLYQRFSSVSGGDLELTLTYYSDESFSDNHLTGASREYNYSQGQPRTWSRTVTLRQGTGQAVCWDLAGEQPLALVTEVKLTFPSVGPWQLWQPYLSLDKGDGQPDPPRLAVADHCSVKAFEHWQYKEGGLSASVDGMHKRALWTPDNYVANTREPTLGYLEPLYGAETGTDQTTCFSISAIAGIIDNCSDAWDATYDSGAEAAACTDADSATLKTLGCMDISFASYGETWQGNGWNVPIAIRVGQWTAVSGLKYRWYVRKHVRGRARGLVLSRRTQARVRSAGNVGDLARREDASSDWQWVQDLSSGQHGEYNSAAQNVMRTDTPTATWTYGLGQNYLSADSIGVLATREFVDADLLVTPTQFRCVSQRHTGIMHGVWNEYGRIAYASCDEQFTGWRHFTHAPVEGTPNPAYPWGDERDHDYPAVVILPTGRVIVAARRCSTGLTEAVYTDTGGHIWVGGLLIGSGLNRVSLVEQMGVVHCAGYYDGKVWYQRSNDAGATLAAFLDGSTSKEVNVSESCVPALTILPTGRVVVSIQNSNGCPLLISDTGGETWQGADVIV